MSWISLSKQLVVNYVFVFSSCVCERERENGKSEIKLKVHTHAYIHIFRYIIHSCRNLHRVIHIQLIRLTDSMQSHSYSLDSQVPPSNLHFNVGPFNSEVKERREKNDFYIVVTLYIGQHRRRHLLHEPVCGATEQRATESRSQIKGRMHEILKSKRHAI